MKLPDGWVCRAKVTGAKIELDAKELICCKNCRHSCDMLGDRLLYCIRLVEKGPAIQVDPEDFCSWAEKEKE